jgi:RimJ/RimL family protein N-acetyltransferase
MILETQRLQLRTICKEDISCLHEIVFSDYEVMQYAFDGKILSIDKTKDFIAKNFAKENETVGLAVLIHKDTKKIVGCAGLLKFEHFTPNSYEIGFVVAKEVWGNGYATEIGKAQIDYALNVFNAKNVYALVSSDNTASLHVIEKLNFNYFDTMHIENRGERKIYKYNEK